MATFEDCLEHLESFYGFLEEHFTDSVAGLNARPVHQINEEDAEAYHYIVTFGRELTDEEAQKFPLHFNGVPVISRVASPGYLNRMKEFEPE